MDKKTVSFLAILIITVLALAGSTKTAMAGWYINSRGWLIYESANVLGDEDEAKQEEKKEEKKEDKKSEVEYFDASQNAWIKAKTEDGKIKTEIQYLTGEKVKSETEGERQEIEAETSQFKLKLKTENGRLKLETETEDGKETELGEDENNEVEIEPDEDDDKIRVATGSGDGEMVFSRNRVRARTNFPLSVDLNTNELIVTTPAGVKRVTVLPDQAINNLLANNVIDRLEPTSEAELELTEENGVPTYEVAGESDQKLLGLVAVKIKSKVSVSAETGEVVKTEKTLRDQLLDLFSF